jgi:hypothetical protein
MAAVRTKFPELVMPEIMSQGNETEISNEKEFDFSAPLELCINLSVLIC